MRYFKVIVNLYVQMFLKSVRFLRYFWRNAQKALPLHSYFRIVRFNDKNSKLENGINFKVVRKREM